MGKLGAVMVSRFRRRFPRAFPPPVPKPGEADIDAPPDQFGNGQFFRAGFRFEPLGHFSGHRDGQLSLKQLQAKAGPFFWVHSVSFQNLLVSLFSSHYNRP